MTCIIERLLIKQFFYSSNSLRVIAVLNVKIVPKYRNKDWILSQKRVFDNVSLQNNLRYKKLVKCLITLICRFL